MWLLVSFDFPVKTQVQRKHYSLFRNMLLEENFMQLQYSVYIRHFPTIEVAKAKANGIGTSTPKNGKTSIFMITDKQYGMTLNFYGKYEDKSATIKKPQQVLLFSND